MKKRKQNLASNLIFALSIICILGSLLFPTTGECKKFKKSKIDAAMASIKLPVNKQKKISPQKK
ncbi:MAG: hypothetical protein HQK52_19750 [Oligoflexia bacterium]|nr:hypothetical protein [Oligoflexia bacterium]